MNKKYLVLLSSVTLLSGCAKTNQLFVGDEYNSPIFDKNYYTDYEGLDKLNLQEIDVNREWSEPALDYVQYGNDCYLGMVNDKFKQGITSKLYDGRTWCDGLYQLSRFQLDKSGFGTKFPFTLLKAERFIFAARGGTSPATSKLKDTHPKMHFNFEITLYKENSKTNYHLYDVILPTDDGGKTAIISFPLTEAESLGVYAYSFKFECVSLVEGLTDDYRDKSKDHLAVMLYEVLMPDSEWYE